jgi:hypothetical protein
MDTGSNKGKAADEKPEFKNNSYDKQDPCDLSAGSLKNKASNTMDCRIFNEILNGGRDLRGLGDYPQQKTCEEEEFTGKRS